MDNKNVRIAAYWKKIITVLSAMVLGVSVVGLTSGSPQAVGEGQVMAGSGSPVRVAGTFNNLFAGCVNPGEGNNWATNSGCQNVLSGPDGNNVYTGTVSLPAGEYAFKIVDTHNSTNSGDHTWYGATPSNRPYAAYAGDGAVNVPWWYDHNSYQQVGNESVNRGMTYGINSYFYVPANGTDVTFSFNATTKLYSVTMPNDPVYSVVGNFQNLDRFALSGTQSSVCTAAVAEAAARAREGTNPVNDFPTNGNWVPACMNIVLAQNDARQWVKGMYDLPTTNQADGTYQFKVAEGLSWYSNWGPYQNDPYANQNTTFRGGSGYNIVFSQPAPSNGTSSRPEASAQHHQTEIVFGPTNGPTCPGINSSAGISGSTSGCGSGTVRPQYPITVNSYTAYDDGATAWQGASALTAGTRLVGKDPQTSQSYTLSIDATKLTDSTGTNVRPTPIEGLNGNLAAPNFVVTVTGVDPGTTAKVTDVQVGAWEYNPGTGKYEAKVTAEQPGLYNLDISVQNIPSSKEPVLLFSPSLRFVGQLTAKVQVLDTVEYPNGVSANGTAFDRVGITVVDQYGDVVNSSHQIMGGRLGDGTVLVTFPSDVTVKRLNGEVIANNAMLDIATYADADGVIWLNVTSNKVGDYRINAMAFPVMDVYRDGFGSSDVAKFIAQPSLSITKKGVLRPDQNGPVGQVVIDYEIVVANTGDVPLTGFRVEDLKLGDNLTCLPEAICASGTLGVGQSVTLTGPYVVAGDADLAKLLVNNEAKACYTIGDSAEVCQPTDPVTTTTHLPQLTITAAPDDTIDHPSVVLNGDPSKISDGGKAVTYTFTINNPSAVTISGITVSDPDATFTGNNAGSWLPGETCAYAAGNATHRGTVPYGQAVLDAGALDESVDPPARGPGESVVCTATYVVDDTDIAAALRDPNAKIIGGFTASGAYDTIKIVEGEPQLATSTIVSTPDATAVMIRVNWLSVVKVSGFPSGSQGKAGDKVDYQVTVTNKGNVELSGVTVVDSMLDASPAPKYAWPDESRPEVLGAGQSVVVTGTHTLTAADVAAKQVVNTAEACHPVAGSDAPQCQPSNKVTTLLPKLTIQALPDDGQLTLNGNPSSLTTAQKTVTYTFNITNDGALPISGITVGKPAFSNDTSWLWGATCAYADTNPTHTGTVTYSQAVLNAGALAEGADPTTREPGESMTCTATYVVDSTDIAAKVINANFTAQGTFLAQQIGAAPVASLVTSEPDATKVTITNPDYQVTYAPGIASTVDPPLAMPPSETKFQNDPVTVKDALATTWTDAAGQEYVFTRWQAPAPLTVTDGTFNMPNTDVELVAQWEKVYPVTYDPGQTPTGVPDVTVPTDTNKYQADASVTVKPQQTTTWTDTSGREYVFAGWESSNASQKFIGDAASAPETFAMPPDSVTLTAQWTPKYVVTYDRGQTEAGIPQVAVPTDTNKYLAGASATRQAALATTWTDTTTGREWRFTGWAADPTVTVAANGTFAMPAADVKFTAQWERVPLPDEHTVSYLPGIASVADPALAMPDPSTHVAGVSVTVKDALATTWTDAAGQAYVFTGWQAPSTVTVASGAFTMPNTNVDFVAQWVKVHPVTYDPGIADVAVPTDATKHRANSEVRVQIQQVTTWVDPLGREYVFAGWQTTMGGQSYTFKGDNTAYETFGMPDAPVTLTAQWTPKYVVTYDRGQTEAGIPEVGVPTDTNKYLAGASATRQAALATTWTDITDRVWRFTGWVADPEVSVAADGSFTMPAGDVKFTAQWERVPLPDEHRVSYAPGIASVAEPALAMPDPSTHVAGVSVAVKDALALTWTDDAGQAYVFTGWLPPTTVTVANGTFTMPNTDVELVAQWARVYPVTYDPGETPSGVPRVTVPTDANRYLAGAQVSVQAQQLTTWIDTRGREYVFAGWSSSTGAAYRGDGSAEALTMPAGPVTLTAQWVAKYTVAYSPGLINGVAPEVAVPTDANKYLAGDRATRQDALVMTWTDTDGREWLFVGWVSMPSVSVANDRFDMPSSDVLFTATWRIVPLPDEHQVFYEPGAVDSGDVRVDVPVDPAAYAQGATVDVLDALVTTWVDDNGQVWVFTGWAAPDAITVDAGSFLMPNDNVTFVAQWTKMYTVAYDPGRAGNAVVVVAVPSDANRYLPGDRVTVRAQGVTTWTDAGGRQWVFTGWTPAPAVAVSNNTFSMPAQNLTLTAQWSPLYTVTYLADQQAGTPPTDGDSPYFANDNVTVLGAGGLALPDAVFAGWETTLGGQTVLLQGGQAFAMPGADVVLTAKWKYPVVYDSGGAPTAAPQDGRAPYFPADSPIVLGPMPAWTDQSGVRHEFLGWQVTLNGQTVVYQGSETFVMPEGRVTLTALWGERYPVTYWGNGNTSGEPPTDGVGYAVGAPVGVLGPGGLVRDGYDFDGWSLAAADDGSRVGATEAMVVGGLDLYAQWTPIEPSLTLVKSADKTRVDSLGERVSYSFVVRNTGRVTVGGVDVTDVMPGLASVTCTGSRTLAPGAELACGAVWTVRPEDLELGGEVVNNHAVASGVAINGRTARVDGNSWTVEVVQRPAISVVKTVDLLEAGVGDQLTYTVRIVNTGNVKVAYSIADVFNGLGPWSKSHTCVDPNASEMLTLGETVILGVGQSVVCTFDKYTVDAADQAVARLVNTVQVTATPVNYPNRPITVQADSPATVVIPNVELPTGGTVGAFGGVGGGVGGGSGAVMLLLVVVVSAAVAGMYVRGRAR